MKPPGGLPSDEDHHSNGKRQTDTTRILNDLHAQESPANEPPKVWNCGEPYEYPIPAPEGDPWGILLAPLMEKDKAQCDAWKDEVQNLLIFAGLFSAVVTAFVIATYPGLQEDPNDTIIMLLSRISNNLDISQNTTSSPGLTASLPPFSPTSSTIRINIYFFISLILSLATVLVGIISLQWIREHQAYTGSFTPQNTFSALHMRSEALEKWRVPEVFSTLPLLLQSALVLFFIGIIEFLLDINIKVAIPVAVVIGLTLIFLLMTTMLPTFQAFLLHHPYLKVNNEVPVQCPYKSPQSRAFRRLITSSKLIFFPLSLTIASIYWLAMRLCLLPKQVISSPPCQRCILALGDIMEGVSAIAFRPPTFLFSEIEQRMQSLLRLDTSKSWSGFDYMTPHIFDYWRIKTSFDFDVMWLCIRDNYFQSICREDSWLYQHRFEHQEHGAIYDATLGLCKEFSKDDVNMNADYESPIITAYHCGRDLSSVNQLRGTELINAVHTRNQYIATLLDYGELTPLSPFPDIVDDLTVPVLAEENAFVLLHAAHYKLIDLQLSSPRISQHLAEIYFRLLGYLYSQPRLTQTSDMSEDEAPEVIFAAEELYIMKIYDAKDQPFTTQWALTLHIYFQIWEHPNVNEIDFRRSFHTHPFLREYIWNFWKEVDNEFSKKSIHADTISQITATLRLIDGALGYLLENGHGHALDCLFYPASLYAQICRRLLADHTVLDAAIAPLLPTLTRCKDHIAARGSYFERIFGGGEYDEDQGMVLFSEDWWDILFASDRSSGISRASADKTTNVTATKAMMDQVVEISYIPLDVTRTNIQFPLAPSEREGMTRPWTTDSIV